PSQIDPTMVPDGKHYMSVFVQYCPYELADGPWDAAKRQAFGATVIDTIARHSPNFKDLILHAEIRTPWDIKNEVGLTEGNIFQGELTMDQLLFNRPAPCCAILDGRIDRGGLCCTISLRLHRHRRRPQWIGVRGDAGARRPVGA